MIDYESMSIEEIENSKVALKQQINEAREEMARAEVVHARKVKLDLAQRVLAAAGIKGVDPVLLAPEPAQLAALPDTPEVPNG